MGIALGVCAGTLVPTWAATPAPSGLATAGSIDSSSADAANAVRLRAEFGLATDAMALARANDSVTDRPSSSMAVLGIPLTPTEAQNILARDALPGIINKIELQITQDPALSPAYGGSWIDQVAGGQIHVDLTSPVAVQAVKIIVSKLPQPTQVSVDQTKFSLTSLKSVQDAITPLIISKSGIGAYALLSAIDEQNNAVVLTVKDSTPSSLISSANAKYASSGLIIKKSNISWGSQSRNHTASGPPLYGGEWISTRTANCTDGYSHATRNGAYLTLTAGHCGYGPFYQGKNQGGRPIGEQVVTKWSPSGSSNCDCEGVGPIPSGTGTEAVYTSDTTLYSYTRTATSTDYKVGNRACFSGAAYADAHGGGIECGKITNASATIPYGAGPFTLTDAVVTNIVGSLDGDSGAPVGNGGTFLGLHAAGEFDFSTGQSIGSGFSKASNIASLGITLGY